MFNCAAGKSAVILLNFSYGSGLSLLFPTRRFRGNLTLPGADQAFDGALTSPQFEQHSEETTHSTSKIKPLRSKAFHNLGLVRGDTLIYGPTVSRKTLVNPNPT